MYLISKVAYKVIIGVGAEDVRSDEDDTDFEKEEEKNGEIEENEGEFCGVCMVIMNKGKRKRMLRLKTDIVIDVKSEVNIHGNEDE